MWPQTQECQGSHQKLEEARNRFSPTACTEYSPARFLASRTGRESISGAPSHQVYSNLLQWSQETSTHSNLRKSPLRSTLWAHLASHLWHSSITTYSFVLGLHETKIRSTILFPTAFLVPSTRPFTEQMFNKYLWNPQMDGWMDKQGKIFSETENRGTQ